MGTKPLLPRLPSPCSTQQNGGPGDWAEPRSTFICKNCSQMFYTEKGLSSHMCFHSDQWPSPRTKQEQVKGRTQQALCFQGFPQASGCHLPQDRDAFRPLRGACGGFGEGVGTSGESHPSAPAHRFSCSLHLGVWRRVLQASETGAEARRGWAESPRSQEVLGQPGRSPFGRLHVSAYGSSTPAPGEHSQGGCWPVHVLPRSPPPPASGRS